MNVSSTANRIKELVAREYSNSNLGIKLIGSTLGIRPGDVYEIFRKETGTELKDFIKNLRIDKGRGLLGNLDLSIKEISYLCGYDSPTMFTKDFGELVGQSPLDCRRAKLDAATNSAVARVEAGESIIEAVKGGPISVTTIQRAFEKKHGMTPSKYREKMLV